MKPGYKTTEFWLSVLASVLAAVLPFIGEYPAVAQMVGIGIAALTALGYTAARTSVKNNLL